MAATTTFHTALHPVFRPVFGPMFRLGRFETPVGVMLIAFDEDGAVRALDWEGYEERMQRLLRLHYGARRAAAGGTVELQEGALPSMVREALEAYVAGETEALATVPVRTGGTAFQREVWAALRTIPAGETVSYRGLAERVGRASAVRAVGLANGSNPVGVIVPCHRVIGTDGRLTGYAGGLERKRWLLWHEGAVFREG